MHFLHSGARIGPFLTESYMLFFQLLIQHGFNYLADKIVAKCKFLVARLQNQIRPCSKVFKIIPRNLIQERTEYINIQKEKQNNLITRFKTNTIYKILWPLSKESTRDTIHRHT